MQLPDCACRLLRTQGSHAQVTRGGTRVPPLATPCSRGSCAWPCGLVPLHRAPSEKLCWEWRQAAIVSRGDAVSADVSERCLLLQFARLTCARRPGPGRFARRCPAHRCAQPFRVVILASCVLGVALCVERSLCTAAEAASLFREADRSAHRGELRRATLAHAIDKLLEYP